MSAANLGSEFAGVRTVSWLCSQVVPRFASTPPGGSDIVRYNWFFPKDGNPGVNIGYDAKNTPRYVAGVWNYIPTAVTTPNR